MRIGFRSIGVKIFVLYILLSIVNISFVITIIYENQIDLIGKNTVLETEKQLAALVASIKKFNHEIRQGGLFNVRDGGGAADQMIKLVEPHVDNYMIFNEKGSVLIDSGKGIRPPDTYLEDGLRSLTAMTFAGMEYYMRIEEERELMHFYIPLPDFPVPASIMLVSKKIGSLGDSLRSLYAQAIYVLIVILFFHGVFAALLYRYIVHPIHLLEGGGRRLMDGDLSVRIAIDRRDEFGSLAETFNRMAESIHANVSGLSKEVEAARGSRHETELSVIIDQATGLFTRHYLTGRLGEEIKRTWAGNSVMALLLIEVDRSEDIDKIYGSQTSTIVLMDIAKTISKTCGETDIIARYRGISFGIISSESSAERARTLAADIGRAIRREENRHSRRGAVGNGEHRNGVCRPGVSEACPRTADLFKQAEDALETAKRCGGNRVEESR
jgi:diguanylate cyclase (GGDEF)-like protein